MVVIGQGQGKRWVEEMWNGIEGREIWLLIRMREREREEKEGVE